MNNYSYCAQLILIILILFNEQIKCKPNSEKNKPNILMIILDDLRPAIHSYDDPLAVTPNIDKLISKSFYFSRAYAQVINLYCYFLKKKTTII